MYYIQATLKSGYIMVEYRATKVQAKRFYDALPICRNKRWGKGGQDIERENF